MYYMNWHNHIEVGNKKCIHSHACPTGGFMKNTTSLVSPLPFIGLLLMLCECSIYVGIIIIQAGTARLLSPLSEWQVGGLLSHFDITLPWSIVRSMEEYILLVPILSTHLSVCVFCWWCCNADSATNEKVTRNFFEMSCGPQPKCHLLYISITAVILYWYYL